MTRRQIEKLADTSNQLGVAAILGSGGDAVLSGARLAMDVIGGFLGIGLVWLSLYFLGLLGDNGAKS